MNQNFERHGQQFNLMLTTSEKTLLDALSQVWSMPAAQVLRQLLHAAHDTVIMGIPRCADRAHCLVAGMKARPAVQTPVQVRDLFDRKG